MDLREELKRITQENLSPGQFLIDVVISARKGPKKVLIIIDGDQGVNIDDCAEMSRHVSKVLDEKNLIDDNYMLEVTSPGIDQPLILKRQYQKNIGRLLKVRLADAVLEGKLDSVSEDHIRLSRETGSGKKKEIKQVDIPFSQIEKAFVQVSFK